MKLEMISAGKQVLARISTTLSEKWLLVFASSICIGLYFYHLYVVWKHAVDVPYMDDWASFDTNQLPSGLSIEGLFALHNEHRLVTARLLVWLLFHLNGWNLIVHQLLNFAVYGAILISIAWFARKAAPDIPGWSAVSFVLYLLSPINWSNHFWAYQSQVHLWLLSLLLAASFLFTEKQTWRNLLVGSVALILSTYSMSGGVVSSLVLLFGLGVYKAIPNQQSLKRIPSVWGYSKQALVVGVLVTVTLLWFVGYSKPKHHPGLVFPYEWTFWSHFLNLVSFGFGIDRISNTLGIFYLIIVVVPVIALIVIKKRNLSDGQWRSLILTLAILCVLASMSAGRAGFGVEQAKESRYFEFAMTLVPLSAVNWAFLFPERPKLRAMMIVTLWVICFYAFQNNWKQFRYYKREAVQRNIGLDCLVAYYKGIGDNFCPTLFPVPIPIRFLENAKALRASFYRRINQAAQAGPA